MSSMPSLLIQESNRCKQCSKIKSKEKSNSLEWPVLVLCLQVLSGLRRFVRLRPSSVLLFTRTHKNLFHGWWDWVLSYQWTCQSLSVSSWQLPLPSTPYFGSGLIRPTTLLSTMATAMHLANTRCKISWSHTLWHAVPVFHLRWASVKLWDLWPKVSLEPD